MKKLLHLLLLPILLLSGIGAMAQKPKAPKALKSYPQDTVATRQWVREYLSGQVKTESAPIPKPEKPKEPDAPVLPKPDCQTGLDLVAAKYGNGQIEFSFQAVDVQNIDWMVAGPETVRGNTGQLTSSRVAIQVDLAPGNYELQIVAGNCVSDPATGKKAFVVAGAPISTPPITNGGVRFIANGTGNSIDFNDPDGISHDKKEQFRNWVQGENGVDAIRLVFSWGNYNPKPGVYRNAELAKAINWVKNLRPDNPPKIRLLFVPILAGDETRIPWPEVQVDNNGNKMDCTYALNTVPSYFSQTATALLGQCYDVMFPFLKSNFGNDIEVVEIAAGQSEEHYMPFTSQGSGNGCGIFSGLGDYSQASREAFRKFQLSRGRTNTELPNVGVTKDYNYNMDYSQEIFRDAALFWGSGISGIWERFAKKAREHTSFKVGMVIPDLLNDQGAKFLFHGFSLPNLLSKCDVFYHSYNLSQWQWHGNLLGSDLLEGTRPGEVISETEVDPHDCGTNNGFGPIDESFVEKSFVKTIEHGARGIHFAMTWDGGQISQMKRVVGKVRARNPQPLPRPDNFIEVRASEIFNNSYFLDGAWRRAGNDTGNPFAASPIRLKLINDL